MAWHSNGDFEKALDYFEQALEIDKAIYEERHPTMAIRYNNLGKVYKSLGESKKAINYFEKALSIFQEAYFKKSSEMITLAPKTLESHFVPLNE